VAAIDSAPSPVASPAAAPTPGAHDPRFHLVCPKCDYNLEGIGDGHCPECGTPYTRDALYQRFLASLRPADTRPELNPARRAAMLSIACVGIALITLARSRPTWYASASPTAAWFGIGALLCAWITAGYWFRVIRSVANPPFAGHVVWMLMLTGASWLICIGHLTTFRFSEAAPVVGTFAGIACYLAIARTPHLARQLWRLACLWPALLAVLMLADGIGGLAEGHHWTNWDDPVPRPTSNQYPMTTTELAWGGLALLIIMIVIEVIGECVFSLMRGPATRP
jgi:hypothetical protein